MEDVVHITRADVDAAQTAFFDALADGAPTERVVELMRSSASLVHGYVLQRIERMADAQD